MLSVTLGAGSHAHDELQARMRMQTTWQSYHDTGGRRLTPLPAQEACMLVHQKPVDNMRVGFELVRSFVGEDKNNFIMKVVMPNAARFWEHALKVRRVTAPLRAERVCRQKTGFSFEPEPTCVKAEPPSCGSTLGFIPEKYLHSKRVCSKRCYPPHTCFGNCFQFQEGKCMCNFTTWKNSGGRYCCGMFKPDPSQCPADCSLDTVIDRGGGRGLCEECRTIPGGPGADGYDFFVFVTIEATNSCGQVPDMIAHALTCVKDQCDRPIFAHINFCPDSISLEPSSMNRQISSATHEMGHALGFSTGMFAFFRNADGTPKFLRDAKDPDSIQGSITWNCIDGRIAWNFLHGELTYVDLSIGGVIGKFDERGLGECPCPVGKPTMDVGCVIAQQGVRTPRCVFRMLTPAVVDKARDFFDCPYLPGPELENQPTTACTIFSSHWEERVFLGELMTATVLPHRPTFVSSVTLALFEDSGWYIPDYAMSDDLTRGVHGGYKLGCGFAMEKCISNGRAQERSIWCTSTSERRCAPDRTTEETCSLRKIPSWVGLVPPSIAYLEGKESGMVGTVPQADYCPLYLTPVKSHVCTDVSSSPEPVGSTNLMREVFGKTSRCLDSNLHADVSGSLADPKDFASFRPGCFKVTCSPNGDYYDVDISDLAGSTLRLGKCIHADQKLTSQEMHGAVICASPEEICGVSITKHLVQYDSVDWTPPPHQTYFFGTFGTGLLCLGGMLLAVFLACVQIYVSSVRRGEGMEYMDRELVPSESGLE